MSTVVCSCPRPGPMRAAVQLGTEETKRKEVKVFIVYWHPEPNSFNHAMFGRACEALTTSGAEVKTSNLYAMGFDPISSRDNFKTVKDPDYLKLQLEEMQASELNGFGCVLNGLNQTSGRWPGSFRFTRFRRPPPGGSRRPQLV